MQTSKQASKKINVMKKRKNAESYKEKKIVC